MLFGAALDVDAGGMGIRCLLCEEDCWRTCQFDRKLLRSNLTQRLIKQSISSLDHCSRALSSFFINGTLKVTVALITT